MEKSNSRVLWLDVLRVLAAFMVVIIHSPKAIEGMASNIYYALYNYIMLPCVPLFFIMSGYLLLPVKEDYFSFLKKRMIRIVSPLFFWSVICILLDSSKLEMEVVNILYIPFFQKANGHYWFLYSLVSVYLFLPIISSWLIKASRKEIEFLLCIWLFVSALPFLNIWLPGVTEGNGNYYNLFYYNAGFLGYFILGFYLKIFYDKKTTTKDLIISFMIMLVVSACHLGLNFWSKSSATALPDMNPYLTIDVIFQSIFIFMAVCKFGDRLHKLRSWFMFASPLTFGIYLVHGLVLRFISFPIVYDNWQLPSVLAVPVCAILTFLTAGCIIYVISKLPKSKYIIG